jgi:glutathione S-transferase
MRNIFKMSDLTVYGSMLSQPVRSVVAFCRLSGIPFTIYDIAFGSPYLESDEFKGINPMQTMPAISHNGYNLWESAAIVPYLADAYNVDNQWYPKDIKIRGRINAYLHWHHQGTRLPVEAYAKAKLIAPNFGAPKLTEETEAPYKAAVEEWFQTFKWQLAETHYAARTHTATIADVFVYSELVNLSQIVNISAHTEVSAWFDEIGEIPVVREITNEIFERYPRMF